MDYNADRSELEKYYKKLAKRADQRLVRLERYQEEKGFESITSFAYRRAMKDLEDWGGGKRFNRKAPRTKQGLVSKIKDIERFLASETSTKQGAIKVYKKKAKQLNKQFGLNLSWKESAILFQTEFAKKLFKEFGYRTALDTIATLSEDRDVTRAKIKDTTSRFKVTGMKGADDEINRFIRKNGLELEDLFS